MRIAKTRHLLNYLDDEAYRRNIGAQLNLHEGRPLAPGMGDRFNNGSRGGVPAVQS